MLWQVRSYYRYKDVYVYNHYHIGHTVLTLSIRAVNKLENLDRKQAQLQLQSYHPWSNRVLLPALRVYKNRKPRHQRP